MNGELRSFLPSAIVLGGVAVLSLWLTATRSQGAASEDLRRKTQIMGALALAAQVGHFAEESITGFDSRFPGILGLAPMPHQLFVSFNLFWILVWAISLVALGSRLPWALFPLWFLALASALNGMAHPILALVDGRYFPGLLTSPFLGVLGLLLLRRLTVLTEGVTAPQLT